MPSFILFYQTYNKDMENIRNKSKRLIIIGNGFDLHLNIKSSFDSFFKKLLFKDGKFYNPTNNILYALFYLKFYCDVSPRDFFSLRIYACM